MPRVASNGSTFLATWIVSAPQSAQLHGSFSDRNGKPLGDPFLITSAYQSTLMVVDGSYLVSTKNAVYEVRVDRTVRKILDVPAIAIASTGGTFLCIDFPIENYQFAPYALVVDREGQTLSRTPIGSLQLASDVRAIVQGDDYVFFNTFDRNLHRLTSAGKHTLIGQLPFGSRALATNGHDILLLRFVFGPPYRAIATILSNEGVAIATADLPVDDGATFAGFNVQTDGGDYLIVELFGEPNTGLNNRNIAVRFDSLTATVRRTQAVGGLETIASSSTAIFGSGIERAAAGLRVNGALLDRAFTLTEARTLSVAQRRQFAPIAASIGTDFLSLWNDQTADEQAISFGRVTQSATPLDGTGQDAFRFAGGMGEFDVTSGGGIYLAVWRWWKQIWAARIAPDGTLLDAQPILVRDSASARAPRVTWGRSTFLITWTEPDAPEAQAVYLRGTTFDPSAHLGAVHDIYRQVTLADSAWSSIGSRALAWTGNSFLVALQINHSQYYAFPMIGSQAWTDVRLMRVGLDGLPIDGLPQNIADAQNPTLASSRNGSLLAYIALDGLHGAAIPPDDQPPVLATSTHYTWPPAVGAMDATWNGWQYVITARYGSNYLGALYVGSDGTPQDRRAALTNDADQPYSISAASNTTGQTIINVSEVGVPGESARNRAYFDSELTTPRAPPLPPIVDAVRIAPDRVLITWRSSTGTEDCVIFNAEDVGTSPLPASTKSIVLQTVRATNVTVYTWNEGGASPTITVALHSVRQRTAPHR